MLALRRRPAPWRAVSVLVVSLAFPATLPALPDDGPVMEGRVVDAVSGQPLGQALVRAGDLAVFTDDTGRFRVGPLPEASGVLVVTAPGYLALELPLTEAPPRGPLELALTPDRPFQEQVEVSAPGVAPETPSTEVVGRDRVLETAGSADNVFRTLRTLPGVAAPEDFSSRISVRGGGPDQNLTIMDGIEVYDPYRLFGLTSAFNPETIERFELTAGGFGAKHGDRLSSLLVIENRVGTRERRLAGSATVALTDANLVAEGRLPGGDGSWLATARRTYYDLVAERWSDSNLPGFTDAQLLGERSLGRGNRLRVQALASRQKSDVSATGYYQGEGADLDATTRSEILFLRLSSTLGGSAHLATTAAWARNRDEMKLEGRFDSGWRRSNAPDDSAVSLDDVDFDRGVAVRDLSLRQDLTWARRRHTIEAGYEVHDLETELDFVIRGGRNPMAANGSSVLGGAGLPGAYASSTGTRRLGAFVQDRFEVGKTLSVQAGARVDHSQITGESTWQPRLAVTVGIPRGGRLRTALGRYAQTPGYEKLYQGDYFVDLSRAREQGVGNQTAWHGLLGYEQPLGRGVTARVEAFYRRFDRLLVGRIETEAERAARLSAYDYPAELASSLPSEAIVTSVPGDPASGRSYGVDAYLGRDEVTPEDRLTGWVSYTYGVAARTAYGRTYPLEYDRRHALSLVSRVRLGGRLEMGLTARASTGFPRTPPLGTHVAAVPDEADADGDGRTNELVPERDGEGRLVYEPYYGSTANFSTARLPMFCRVDVRFTYRPRGRKGRFETYLDVINVFNRKNAELLRPSLAHDPAGDRPLLVEEPGGSVGILPSAGLRLRF